MVWDGNPMVWGSILRRLWAFKCDGATKGVHGVYLRSPVLISTYDNANIDIKVSISRNRLPRVLTANRVSGKRQQPGDTPLSSQATLPQYSHRSPFCLQISSALKVRNFGICVLPPTRRRRAGCTECGQTSAPGCAKASLAITRHVRSRGMVLREHKHIKRPAISICIGKYRVSLSPIVLRSLCEYISTYLPISISRTSIAMLLR